MSHIDIKNFLIPLNDQKIGLADDLGSMTNSFLGCVNIPFPADLPATEPGNSGASR